MDGQSPYSFPQVNYGNPQVNFAQLAQALQQRRQQQGQQPQQGQSVPGSLGWQTQVNPTPLGAANMGGNQSPDMMSKIMMAYKYLAG